MLDTGLDNPLLADDSGLGNAVAAVTAPAGNPYHSFEEGEDGNWYRDGERVYYWVPPSETNSTIRSGGETQGIGEDLGGYYTQDEILSYWNADEGMGYLKEQTSLENYLGFLEERQQKIQSGELTDPIQAGYYKEARANAVATTDPDAIESERQEEAYYAQLDRNAMSGVQDMMAGWVDQNSELMGKYGIDGAFQNEDKDWLVFNGSTYTRVYKEDDHSGKYGKWLGVVGEIAKNIMLSGGFGAIGGAVAPIVHGGLTAMGVPASVATILAGGAFAGAPGQVRKNTTRSGMMDDVNRVLNDPNIIINFTESGWEPPNTAGDDYKPEGEWLKNGAGEYIITSPNELPIGYILNDGFIVHEATGTVMSEYIGDMGTNPNLGAQIYTFAPYVDPTDENESGGGGGSTNSSSSTSSSSSSDSSGAPASDASADEWRAYADQLKQEGIEGIDLIGALQNAGISSETFRSLNQDGWSVYSEPTIKANSPPPQLVIYDGDPKLLDPNGPWQPGGTEFDRTDPANPRRYYVWTNSETGEEWKIYDDELGSSDQVADYEAYIKERLPDVTEEEQAFIRRLIELGDPIGQAIEDVVASRGDLNETQEPATITVNTPSGPVTVPNPNATNTGSPTQTVGQPCTVGTYKGVIETAPSGNLFCNITASITETPVTPPTTPAEGDVCDLTDADGNVTGKGTIQGGVCQAATTTPTLTVGSPCKTDSGDSGFLDEFLECKITTTPTQPQPGDLCKIGDESGTLDKNLVCVIKPSVGGACTIDGKEGAYDKDLICQPTEGGGSVDGTNGTGSKAGDACTVNGQAGTLDADLNCQVTPTGPQPGDSCTIDGKDGKIDENGTCQPTVNPGPPTVTPTTFTVGTSTWGTGPGTGPGNGPGDGPGEGGGENGGGGKGGGQISTRGSYTPSWSPLFATNQFRKFNKNRGNNKAMAALQPNTNLSAPKADFSQSRLNLFSDLIKDLK